MPELKDCDTLSSPWICAGDDYCWDGVLPYGSSRKYRKKDIIIAAGQTLDALAYLKSGFIKTVFQVEGGQEKIIWFMEAGCVLGETPLLNNKPCAYYFRAVQDCQIYWFSKAVLFDVILEKHPKLTKSLLTIMARKVHVLSTQLEDQVFRKPVFRVAKLIYQYYRGRKETGQRDYPPLPVSQEDIANLLGLHRVTVNQILQTMRSGGILENHTHRIIVRDLGLLEKLAN